MRLSAPIYRLKHDARQLSRRDSIPLHAALDRIAALEGFRTWSQLAAKHDEANPASHVFARLRPGELLVTAARPGQGKTLFCLELSVEAIKQGHRAYFFSLEYTEQDVASRLERLGFGARDLGDRFVFDGSEQISADYIIGRMQAVKPGSLVVVDYLQLLDQVRSKPDLATQVHALKQFARDSGLIIAVIAQVDRCFETSGRDFPDLADIRRPNPFDLTLFDRTCFLSGGKVRFQ